MVRKLQISKLAQRDIERSTARLVDFDLVNGRPSAWRRRVVRLVELLKAADALSNKLRARKIALSATDKDGQHLLGVLTKANRILNVYRGSRQFWVESDFSIGEVFGMDAKLLDKNPSLYTETRIVAFVLELLRTGSIQRVRTCNECRKWFYAMTDHQLYCGGNCRQRFASHDKSFKHRRREYMKKYREQERQREQRSREALRSRRP